MTKFKLVLTGKQRKEMVNSHLVKGMAAIVAPLSPVIRLLLGGKGTVLLVG
jgi:hypothetical protein